MLPTVQKARLAKVVVSGLALRRLSYFIFLLLSRNALADDRFKGELKWYMKRKAGSRPPDGSPGNDDG